MKNQKINQKDKYILGIESSCDDTGIGLIKNDEIIIKQNQSNTTLPILFKSPLIQKNFSFHEKENIQEKNLNNFYFSSNI